MLSREPLLFCMACISSRMAWTGSMGYFDFINGNKAPELRCSSLWCCITLEGRQDRSSSETIDCAS